VNTTPSSLCCVALLCVLSTSILHAEDSKPAEVNITGTWKAHVEVAGQTGEPMFALKQDGDKITGTYTGSFGEKDVNGKVAGDKVAFEFTLDQGKVVYTGRLHWDVDRQAGGGRCKECHG
jgi:hypothetical protein